MTPVSPSTPNSRPVHGRAGHAAAQAPADDPTQLGVESFAALFADSLGTLPSKGKPVPEADDPKTNVKATEDAELAPFMAWPGWEPPATALIPVKGEDAIPVKTGTQTLDPGLLPLRGTRDDRNPVGARDDKMAREPGAPLPPGFVPVDEPVPALAPKTRPEETAPGPVKGDIAELAGIATPDVQPAAQHQPHVAKVAMPEFTIAAPVHAPGFAEQVAEKVAFIANHKIEEARLRVSPEALGPIEVRINLEEGRAAIAITAPSEAARTALENSFGMLAERLADQGLALDSATVSDGRNGGAFQDDRPAPRMSRAPIEEPVSTPEAIPLAQRRGNGLVDDFA